MRKFYLIGFAILLCCDTLAQTSFKLAAAHADSALEAAIQAANHGLFSQAATLGAAWILRLLTESWIYCAVGSYLGAFVTYMTLLKHAPIGPAFAATHLEIVTCLLVSYFFLGEQLMAVQLVGGCLIMFGIYLLGTEKQPDLQPSIAADVEHEVPKPSTADVL